MAMTWETITLSDDATFYHFDNQPVFHKKFIKALKFHAPGLAAVSDANGAYHINMVGNPVYARRFLQTFGYYQGLAAVEADEGWLHIDSAGNPVYDERYAWCGNFQEGLCVVQDKITRNYFHINTKGLRNYSLNYRYVGDYRDGIAVVCAENELHTHIDKEGEYIHQQWFQGLDVFHKGVARAKDSEGWFHINRQGQQLYKERYKTIEPYYNNIAHVEDFAGRLFTIDLTGKLVTVIAHTKNDSILHELSADLVGFWKTQTIYAAVQLGVFNVLPNTIDNITHTLKLDKTICERLLRALQELNLIEPGENYSWQLTVKGKLFKPIESSGMAAAAIIWGDSHYKQWADLLTALRHPEAKTEYYFNQMAADKILLEHYQRALQIYATADYELFLQKIDWQQHHKVIDAGGGTGTLLHKIINVHSHLIGFLLDMPAVVNLADRHSRCQYYGINLLDDWPCQADAIILARVLHDWCDDEATQLLQQARKNLIAQGSIYILEMVIEPFVGRGGLLDLNMLVMTGGRERTLEDWQQLANASQLKIVNNLTLSPIVNLLILKSNS